MRKVKVGCTYVYVPVLMDRSRPASTAVVGQYVTVRNMPGCPPANTMGHCHIGAAGGGEFLGLVCCNSLYRNVPLWWRVTFEDGTSEEGTSDAWKTLKGASKALVRRFPTFKEIEVRSVLDRDFPRYVR